MNRAFRIGIVLALASSICVVIVVKQSGRPISDRNDPSGNLAQSEGLPRLIDLGATALDMFGVEVPAIMDGRPLTVADVDGSFPRNSQNTDGSTQQG